MDTAAANATLDSVYGAAHSSRAPATWYLALFKDSTYAVELTQTGGVPRIAITNNSTNWPDAADAQKALAVDFNSAASTGVWAYDATAWALMDSATAGNRWDGGDVDALANDTVGTVIPVPAGSLTISIDTD